MLCMEKVTQHVNWYTSDQPFEQVV